MEKLTLYLGTKNISSWSLRPWLALMQTGAQFEEVLINLCQPDTQEKISQFSSSGKVPVLKHNDFFIWESLAICEYLAEIFPDANLWPRDLKARALARSISTEMHAGFLALRQYLPMDIKGRFKDHPIPEAALKDISRITQIWKTCRSLYGKSGDFLFGNFTVADAMFAPVATRFVSYDVKLPQIAHEYTSAIMNLSAMKQWCSHT